MERLGDIVGRVLAGVRPTVEKIAGDETSALMHPVVCPAEDTRPAPRGGGPKTTGGNDRRIVQRGR